MARLLRHRQTKGAETDKPNLRPTRHISTLLNTSAAIADPLLRQPSAGGLAPRTLTVLHEYASGPHGSARRSRNAAQRFRDEPSWI